MQLNQNETINDDDHVLKMWTPLNLNITEDFKYVKTSFVFNLLSRLLYIIVYPILYIYNTVIYGLVIEGKENIKSVKGGKITISNHVHPMDCTINAIINAPKKMYFPTLKSNFEIPVIRHIIKLLYAIPIPDSIDRKKDFFSCIDKLLQNGETIHLYPEAAMWPYCKRLRKFKDGAFRFAMNNNVPIVPIVYTFRKPEGVYAILKKRPCITAKILEPVHHVPGESFVEYKKRIYDIMDLVIKESYDV